MALTTPGTPAKAAPRKTPTPTKPAPETPAAAAPETPVPTLGVKMTRSTKRRLILSDEGLEGSGKTHFAFTAPGPIAYFIFDVGHEGVVDKFVDTKDIYGFDYRLQIRPALGRDGRESEVIGEAVELRDRFDRDFKTVLTQYRTVVIDTASELWALYRMAEFGRVAKIPPALYEAVNTKFRELLRLGYEHNANLILLHKLKARWENNEKTGELERAGFGDIGYLTQINLRSVAERIEGGGVEFSKTVLKCRPNADVLGNVYKNLAFTELATLAYPDTDEAEWE